MTARKMIGRVLIGMMVAWVALLLAPAGAAVYPAPPTPPAPTAAMAHHYKAFELDLSQDYEPLGLHPHVAAASPGSDKWVTASGRIVPRWSDITHQDYYELVAPELTGIGNDFSVEVSGWVGENESSVRALIGSDHPGENAFDRSYYARLNDGVIRLRYITSAAHDEEAITPGNASTTLDYFTARLQVVGSEITLFWNGDQVLQSTDARITERVPAFMAWQNGEGAFPAYASAVTVWTAGSPIPEPRGLALLGLSMLAARRRRRT